MQSVLRVGAVAIHGRVSSGIGGAWVPRSSALWVGGVAILAWRPVGTQELWF